MILKRLSAALDQRLRRFLNKDYRDGYLQTHVRSGIGYQIRALREKAGLSQVQFAEALGKKQSTVSRLEDTEYGRVTVQSLLDVACAMNVALLVRFVDYPQFLRVTADMSPQALGPESIFESAARANFPAGDEFLTHLYARREQPVGPSHRDTLASLWNADLAKLAERQKLGGAFQWN